MKLSLFHHFKFKGIKGIIPTLIILFSIGLIAFIIQSKLEVAKSDNYFLTEHSEETDTLAITNSNQDNIIPKQEIEDPKKLISAPVQFSHVKTIHIFVALCDNKYQGIVPVPTGIGNGQKPNSNLYWGCGYGIKHYFHKKTEEWTLVKTFKSTDSLILDRRLFKHRDSNIYMLADAYNGKEIYSCNEDMVLSLFGKFPTQIEYKKQTLNFGGSSNLVAYIGHNGLMDFDLNINLDLIEETTIERPQKDCIILACASRSYYTPFVQAANAHPLVWTTSLMAPEAYTLDWALTAWVLNKTPEQVSEQAAQAYNHYQNCGINGARRLLVNGF